MTISSSTTPTLTLPHPHLFERAFVLVPLAEIAPDRVIGGLQVRDALARVDAAGIEKLRRAIGRRHANCTARTVGRDGPAWHFATMTGPETLPPAADFAPATGDDWRKLVDGVLKGAPFARLESRTYDGLPIEPLYPRAAEARAIAGRAPGTAWTIMQRVDHPDPALPTRRRSTICKTARPDLCWSSPARSAQTALASTPTATILARVLDGVQLDRHCDRPQPQPSLAPHRPRLRRAGQRARAKRRARSICASASIRSAVSPHRGQEPAKLERDRAPDFAAMVGELAGAGFRGPFAVADGRIIHNAGGSEAQELAFALASARRLSARA